MRVCVTGGTGFVGRVLVRRLIQQGNHVRVLARPSPRADALAAQGADVVHGDLGDADSVARAIAGAEIVYHCAAKVGDAGTHAQFIETNAGGTARVLEACHANAVRRLVYLSSIAVYGLAHPGERIDENTPFDPHPEARDAYAHSKILADQEALAFARGTGLPVTILREGLVYGPGRPLPTSLLGFRAGKAHFAFANRRDHFPLNYVENLVDAMLTAAQAQDSRPHQYILLDDDDLTLSAYHKVRAEVERSPAFFFPGWPVLASASIADAVRRALSIGQREGASFSAYQVTRALEDRCYDSSRIRRETGWSPRISLREATAHTLSMA